MNSSEAEGLEVQEGDREEHRGAQCHEAEKGNTFDRAEVRGATLSSEGVRSARCRETPRGKTDDRELVEVRGANRVP